MEIIRGFEKTSKNDSYLAGGKGASLGELTQADFAVPQGFIILSAAFEKFLEETDLNTEIETILTSLDYKDIHAVENASEKIKSLILSIEIPKDIADEIQKFFKNLNVEFVAVRSSATAEDGVEHAWAGQLESYLNTTEENLLENIRKCWTSLFTPRAIFYRFEKKLHAQKISVAVVVQRMIQSEVSGIAFSVHPVTQDKNQLIIEAGFGLGEAIVSGSVTPDSYIVAKDTKTILERNFDNKSVLTEEQIIELTNLIVKIENHFGFPCDIEWTFEKGKFYILQSRPITTLKEGLEIKASDKKFVSFENPIYPYFYSSTANAPKQKFKDKFLMGGWYVKFRYGTTSIVDAPVSSFNEYGDYFLELLLNKDNEFENYVFELAQKLIELNKKLEERNYADLKNETISNLEDFYHEFDQIYSKAIGIGYSLDYALDKYVENEKIDVHTIENKYYSFAQKEKYELQQIFKNTKDFENEISEHALRYSWLQNDYSGEYRLNKEDFINRKSEILKENIVYSDNELQKPNSILEWINFLTMMRDERKKANLIVDGLLDRYLSQECEKYGVSREIAVMSSVDEFEKNKNGSLKNYQGIRTAEVIRDGLVDISNEKWEMAVKDILIDSDAKTIQGVSAMTGKVIGKAKVILSRNDFHKLNDGNILVTSMTRPEFTQVLSKVSAIITNEGGITCHAAIIARELKKPCIIGTKIATKILKDGDKIEVDANSGVIKILEN
jgi:phosphohistidine swiveling domain-containing protein